MSKTIKYQYIQMISDRDIRNWVNEHLEGTDRYLVDVLIKSGNRILVFIDSDTSVLIEHCINLSKYIESQLDRDIEDFELNVSSAGLDHPYKMVRQYLKNIGREVSVVHNDGRRIAGKLIAADEQGFEVLETTKVKKVVSEISHHFQYNEIKETKEIIKF
jgi:ribosome maturation factor RimP